MSSTNGSLNQVSAEVPKESSKTIRRFYAIVTLLQALNKAYSQNLSHKKIDEIPQSEDQEEEGIFRSLVSRLGQICDAQPGGSTVTAFTVLKLPDRVQYVFASNKRTPVELATVKGYISAVLSSLRDMRDTHDIASQIEYKSGLLRDVLIFNRDRIRSYTRTIASALEHCVRFCQNPENLQYQHHRIFFQNLWDLADHARDKSTDDDENYSWTARLIEALQNYQQSDEATFVLKQASKDQAGNSQPWRQLRHCASRLISYQRAVDTLWQSTILFPELFDDFEVIPIRSSGVHTNPLLVDPQSASDILNRYLPTTDSTTYCKLAELLQSSYDLNAHIAAQWQIESFKPYVHAEVLVLDWMEHNGGTRPERFFNNWRYIGCSKPTCRLCYYYFENHPSGVNVRNQHGNLYPNWRMPDLHEPVNDEAAQGIMKERLEILQATGSALMREVLRTLRDKSPATRRQDSATISSLVTRLPHRESAETESLNNDELSRLDESTETDGVLLERDI